MRRLMDLAVAAVFVFTVVITVQSFRREKSPPPPPEEPVVVEPPPAETAIEPPTPRSEVVMIGGGPAEIVHGARAGNAADEGSSEDEETSGLVSVFRSHDSGASSGRQTSSVRVTAPPSSDGWSRNRTPRRSSPASTVGGGASEAEAKRAAARVRLESAYRSIGSKAGRLIRDAQEYARTCGNDTQNYCGASLERIGRQAIDIGRELRDAQELARTSWLNPGEVRELREKNGLDDAVWDRLIALVNKYSR